MSAGPVLHVVWEYPPVIYGGLTRHAEGLTRVQRAAGWAVTVVTAAEDVTRVTGLLIDVGDVHAPRDAISLLLAQPSLAHRLAQAAARAVREPTWPAVARQTFAAYAVRARRRPLSGLPAYVV